MSKSIYVTYLTIYSGSLLPPYYIGSTYLENITENNYRGSVVSKKYGKFWKSELKDNPHLFETIIIKKFNDRKEAISHELELHVDHNIVKNPLFINLALATINGFFGMDVNGCETSFYNKHHNTETKKIMSELKLGKLNYRFKGYYHTPFGKLESTREIKQYTNLISRCAIHTWCKYPLNKRISKKNNFPFKISSIS